ncbi:hypothetical protein, partial [Streptomyces violaceusniger]|uniref:hypothetical protein n=1 Tax=Streptomyces violaceusniger TaxID=68280 RepID=UPI0031E3656D
MPELRVHTVDNTVSGMVRHVGPEPLVLEWVCRQGKRSRTGLRAELCGPVHRHARDMDTGQRPQPPAPTPVITTQRAGHGQTLTSLLHRHRQHRMRTHLNKSAMPSPHQRLDHLGKPHPL